MSLDPWPWLEGSMREAETLLVMGRYVGSVVTERGSGWGSKTKLEGINFSANGAVGELSRNVLRLIWTCSMVGERSLR